MTINSAESIKPIGLFWALGALLLPGICFSQQYYDPGLLQKTIESKPADFQPPGARVGGFMMYPGIELAYEENDNIFYDQDGSIGDSIVHIRPWLNLNSDWNRHSLNFNFFADIGRYKDFDTENYEDTLTSLNGHIDVKQNSNFNYAASYMQLHEDRSSPDDVGGIKPTDFIFSRFRLGYNHRFNRLNTALDYTIADTDYDNNVNGEGDILDNQDRDRSEQNLILGLGYELSDRTRIIFNTARTWVEYDQEFDSNGFSRSSDGYSLQGGLSWDMTGVLVGDLFLEYIKRKYDDPRFDDTSGFGLGASLLWTPTELTNVNILVKNAQQETTQIGTSGFFSTLYSVRVQHELRRNWLLHARASYTDNDYDNSGDDPDALNTSNVLRAGAGVSYLFSRNFYISTGYVFEQQSANSSVFEYTTNRWFITLGAEF